MSSPDLVHGADADRWGGWSWAEPRGPEHFRRCSYCGCVHPEDLVAEKGWHAEWADRKYGWPHKFYAQIPDRDGKLDWLGGTSGGPPQSIDQLHARGYKTPEELTDEERAACESVDLGRYRGVRVGRRDSHFGKFYTVHLADPDVHWSTKREISRRCGLVFEFEDGRVRWREVGR